MIPSSKSDPLSSFTDESFYNLVSQQGVPSHIYSYLIPSSLMQLGSSCRFFASDTQNLRQEIINSIPPFKTFNVGLVGNSKAGKSSLLASYINGPSNCEDSFITYPSSKRLPGRIELKIYDPSSHPDFNNPYVHKPHPSYDFMFILCDLTDIECIDDARGYLNETKTSIASPTTRIYLVGTKLDAVIDKQISDLLLDCADAMGLEVFLTSAKTGENVNELFETAVKNVIDYHTVTAESPVIKSKTDLQKDRRCQIQ